MSAGNEEEGARRPHSPTLLRKGIPGERKPLKEKLITYYEQLFKVRALVAPSSAANILLKSISTVTYIQGEDPSEGNPRFWEEFFLLKVSHTCLHWVWVIITSMLCR